MTTVDIAGLLTSVALRLQDLERDMCVLLGVDDELVAAIAALPEAVVDDTVYVSDGEEPYVLRAAEVRIGRVTLRALAHRRPASSAEIESAGGWHEQVTDYRSARLSRVKP
jgi:chloramphenicol 3-O-phosphotransferase